MNNRLTILVILGFLIASGCHQPENQAAVSLPVAPKNPPIMAPFRFHKLIEVSPGNDFDILSWGRGSSMAGSLLILHSDSSGIKYTTTTGDLDGTIVDVYNSDMDLDGNPEILIQAKAKDTTNYAIIYAYEFEGSKAQKLDFPKLNSSQRKGYQGGDNFYIQDGKFMRQFPVYEGDGTDAEPTGEKRLLEYGLRNNEFTVKEIIKDTTGTATKKAVITPSVKKTDNQSPSKKSTEDKPASSKKSTNHKTKKHKTEEKKTTHHKKKKHQRHNDDN